MQTVKEIMTKDVETLLPTATIQEAAEKMKNLDVGVLPVCDGEEILGMVTDRDIAIKAVAYNQFPSTTPVNQIMTPHILYCYDDQDAEEALNIMEANKVRRLIVVNRDKKLVGIASLGNLAVKSEKENQVAKTLEKISEPGR